MNRLDHEMLIKSIHRVRKDLDCDPAYLDAIDSVAENIAFDMWVQNPLFDRQEFLSKIKEDH